MLHLMQLFYRINTARPNELGPFMHRDPQQKAPSMVQPQYGSINDPIDVDDDSQQSLPRPQEYSTASRAHEGNPNQGYSSVKLESQPEIQQQPEQQQQPEIQEQVTEELRSASTASDAFTFPDTPWPEPPQVRAIVNGTDREIKLIGAKNVASIRNPNNPNNPKDCDFSLFFWGASPCRSQESCEKV